MAELKGTRIDEFMAAYDKNGNTLLEREEWDANAAFNLRGTDAVLAIRPGGRGDVTKTHVLWRNDKGVPYVASPLYYQGRVYLIKLEGMATCYEASTGRLIYDRKRLGSPGDHYMSPLAVDGKIYCGSIRGLLVVLAAGDEFRVLARNDLGEGLFATPAVVQNTLYVRTEKHLWALGEGK